MSYIEKIDEYIRQLKTQDFSYIDRKINAFDVNFNFKTIKDYENIDIDKFVKNLILLQLVDLDTESFDKVKKLLEKKDFNYLYDEYKKMNFPKHLYTVEVICDKNGEFDDITPHGKKFFELLKIKDLYDPNDSLKNYITAEDYINEINEKARNKLFPKDFLSDVLPCNMKLKDEALIDMYDFLINMHNIEDFDNQIKRLQEENRPFFDSQKDLKLYLKKVDITQFIDNDIKRVKYAINLLLSEKQKLEKQRASEIKKLNKQKEYIKNLKSDLSLLDKIDFGLLSKIDNNLYKYIFIDLFKDQKSRYEKANEDYMTLKKIDDASYLVELFKRFKINYYSFDDKIKNILIESKNINNLEKNMKSLNIDSNDDINYELIYFLLNTPNKDVKSYEYYIQNKIISKKFLLDNLYIFNEESFIKNLSIIKDNRLSFNSLNYDDNILLSDSNELENNNSLLKLYNKDKKDNNFSYLFDCYSFDLLDLLIENDLDINLMDNYLLDKRKIDNFIKRFLICDSLGIPIYDDKYNVNINFLLGYNFYCDQDKLDNYILKNDYENEKINEFLKNNKRNLIDYDICKASWFDKIEHFKSDDGLFYDFNGIIISRPKVIRNLTLFHTKNIINDETILSSIIYNSNLTNDEVELIKDCIFNKSYKIKKHSV